MCCEDVKIDWEKKSEIETIVLTGASQEILGPDPHRWSIAFGQPSAGTLWVTVDGVAATGTGFLIPAGTNAQIFTREQLGSAIGKAWFGFGSNAGATISVIECLLLPGGICSGKGY